MAPMVDSKLQSNGDTKLAQELQVPGPSVTQRRTWRFVPAVIMSTLIPASVWLIQHVLQKSDNKRFSDRPGEIEVVPGILSFRRFGFNDQPPPPSPQSHDESYIHEPQQPYGQISGYSLVPTLTLGFEGVSLTVMIVSVLGLYAFIKGSQRLLKSYLACVVITVTIQAGIVFYQLLLSTRWIEDTLDRSWGRAYETDPELIWGLQNEFDCRGYNHVQDRAALDFSQGSNMDDHLSPTPCSQVLKARFGKRMQHLGLVLLCIRLIQLAGVLSLATLIVYLSEWDREKQEMDEREQEQAEENELLVSVTLDIKHDDKS